MRKIRQVTKGFVFVIFIFVIGCGSSNLDKAQDYLSAGMYEDAVTLLKIEAQDNPKNPEGHYLLGYSLLFLDNLPAAEESFDRSILLDTKYRNKVGKGYYDIGVLKLQKNEKKETMIFFKKAREKDPELRRDIAIAFYEEGKKRTTTNTDAKEAVELFTLCLEIDPEIGGQVGKTCLDIANSMFEKGFVDSAVDYSLCSIRSNPKDKKSAAKILYEAAIAYADKGEDRPFKNAYRQAVEHDPDYTNNDPKYFYASAKYYLSIGNLQRAKTLIEEVNKNFTDNEYAKKSKLLLENILEKRLVGTWDWFNKVQGFIRPDGTLMNSKQTTGKWHVSDRAKKQVTLDWKNGKWVDKLYLSKNGDKLKGKNQFGHNVRGNKVK